MLRKNIQTAELLVVTMEKPKFIKPVDTTILSMIPQVIRIWLRTWTIYLKQVNQISRATQSSSPYPKIAK